MKKQSRSIRLLNFFTQFCFWATVLIGFFLLVSTVKGVWSGQAIIPSEVGERFSYKFPFFENDVQNLIVSNRSGAVETFEVNSESWQSMPMYLKWVMWLNPLLMVGFLFSMIYFFRQVVMKVYRGEFFDQYCIDSLKKLSIVMVVAWFYELIMRSVINVSLQTWLLNGENNFTIRIGTTSISLLIIALFMWSLSIIFQEGLVLKQDNELTV